MSTPNTEVLAVAAGENDDSAFADAAARFVEEHLRVVGMRNGVPIAVQLANLFGDPVSGKEFPRWLQEIAVIGIKRLLASKRIELVGGGAKLSNLSIRLRLPQEPTAA